VSYFYDEHHNHTIRRVKYGTCIIGLKLKDKNVLFSRRWIHFVHWTGYARSERIEFESNDKSFCF